MDELRIIAQIIDGAEKKVGDGFNISSPMPGSRIRQLSPFLLIDHVGPMLIEPTEKILGSDAHPHRGFETVTLVYSGGLDHRDTGGHNGSIGPLDVQWMTAGSGLLHEEKYGREFSKQGGVMEFIQLWVNLSKKDKMVQPRYQELGKEMIPVISEQQDDVILRVISGTYGNIKGPALTFSAIDLWDLRLTKGTKKQLTISKDYNLGIYVIRGKAKINNREALTKQLINFGWNEELVDILAEEDCLLLILAGKPIEESLATYGPFVMNTNEELIQTIADYEAGKFGSF